MEDFNQPEAPVIPTEAPVITEQAPEQSPEQAPPSEGFSSAKSLFVVIVGWLIPGFGHLIQKRYGRALIGFLAVGAMAMAGLWMRGNVFPPHRDDAFGLLGFIADAGSGMFYLLAHTIQKAGSDVSRAAGDNGTRLFATAGVLNLLFILDALEVSRGHKN